MAQDPAFLFYPGDYLRDTQILSEAAQVAYDRIMCEHMRTASINPEDIYIDVKTVKFFTKKLSDDEKEELFHVLDKVDNGYQIQWVAESLAKRKSYTQSRKNNRKKSPNQKTHIYLIIDKKTHNIKIGNSVDPQRRLGELKSQIHNDLELLFYTEKTMQKNETKLHKHYSIYNISGEWFSLIPNDVINHIVNHMGIKSEYHMIKHMENVNENENENIIKEGIEKKPKIPTEQEFIEYASRNKPNVDLQEVRLKYRAWVENDWKDGKGNSIKKWTSKLLQTLPYIKETKLSHRTDEEITAEKIALAESQSDL